MITQPHVLMWLRMGGAIPLLRPHCFDWHVTGRLITLSYNIYTYLRGNSVLTASNDSLSHRSTIQFLHFFYCPLFKNATFDAVLVFFYFSTLNYGHSRKNDDHKMKLYISVYFIFGRTRKLVGRSRTDVVATFGIK